MKVIAYYRVSTKKQGESGLGLDAQRKAVVDYLNGGKWVLTGEFVEVESGKKNDRPQLAAVPIRHQHAEAAIGSPAARALAPDWPADPGRQVA